MWLHFWRRSRDLGQMGKPENESLFSEIDALDEDTAEQVFWHHKWKHIKDCNPRCDECGSPRYYWIRARRRFNCVDCRHQYTSTSKTIFAGSKLSFKQMLKAVCLADEPDLTRARVRDIVGVSESGASPILARIRVVRLTGSVWKNADAMSR